jgi:hypothetical protein
MERTTRETHLAVPAFEGLIGVKMWQRNCLDCRQRLQEKDPTEIVPCSRGKYIWER